MRRKVILSHNRKRKQELRMLSCVTCGQNDEFTEKSEEKNSFPSERPCWRAIPGFAGFNVCIFCQTRIWKSAFQTWRLMPNLYWNLSNLKTVEIWKGKMLKHCFVCVFASVCICSCVCISLSCRSFPWLGYLSLCFRPPAESLKIFCFCGK